jgi:hypothetical protein
MGKLQESEKCKCGQDSWDIPEMWIWTKMIFLIAWMEKWDFLSKYPWNLSNADKL